MRRWNRWFVIKKTINGLQNGIWLHLSWLIDYSTNLISSELNISTVTHSDYLPYICYNLPVSDTEGAVEVQNSKPVSRYNWAHLVNFDPIYIQQKRLWVLIIIDLTTFSSSLVNRLSCLGTVLNSASAAGRCYSFAARLRRRSPDLSPVVWKIYDPALKSMGTLCEGLYRLMDHFLNQADPFSFHKGTLLS